MRYRFDTLSSARYLIDTDAMTWKRANDKPGHRNILGLDVNEGDLHSAPNVTVGIGAYIQFGPGLYDYIRTTPVMRVELLDD